MELIDYVRMLGRRWRVWLSLMLLGTVLGALYAVSVTKIYSASTEEYVAAASTHPLSESEIKDANDTILTKMASWASLINSPDVLAGTLQDSKSTLTQSQLSGHLTAVQIPRTVILKVTATDKTPAVAAQLSAAAAKRLASEIVTLETPSVGGAADVQVVITKPARVPTHPSKPNKFLVIALGLLAGAGVGLVAASLRDQYLTTVPEPRKRLTDGTPDLGQPEPVVERGHAVVTIAAEPAAETYTEPTATTLPTPEPAAVEPVAVEPVAVERDAEPTPIQPDPLSAPLPSGDVEPAFAPTEQPHVDLSPSSFPPLAHPTPYEGTSSHGLFDQHAQDDSKPADPQ